MLNLGLVVGFQPHTLRTLRFSTGQRDSSTSIFNIMASTVSTLDDEAAYRALLQSEANSVQIVEFVGKSCKACQTMQPRIERFAAEWPDIAFRQICAFCRIPDSLVSVSQCHSVRSRSQSSRV